MQGIIDKANKEKFVKYYTFKYNEILDTFLNAF